MNGSLRKVFSLRSNNNSDLISNTNNNRSNTNIQNNSNPIRSNRNNVHTRRNQIQSSINNNNRKKYYLPLPFISNQFNYRITRLFRKYNYDITVANKSTNKIRNNLSKSFPSHKKTCGKRSACPTKQTNICYKTNVIYHIECGLCNKFYIGSTNQYLHDRVYQHLTDKEASINEHLINAHRKQSLIEKQNTITIKILQQCNTMKDLLPIEAIHIRPHYKKNPQLLNKKEEMKDILNLLS